MAKNTQNMLSPSGKARLCREQAKLIAYLTLRLTTCDLADFDRIKADLLLAKEGYNALLAHATKPKRVVSRRAKQ